MRERSAAFQIAALLGVAVPLVAGAACRGTGLRNAKRLTETEDGRFPHAIPDHTKTPCVSCHAMGDVLAGRLAVPGADDHAPCDREQCHQEEFLRPPGTLCKLCHREVKPTEPGSSVLAAYPPVRGPRSLASRFSHSKHLDYGRMESRVGFHVSCSDCHLFDDKGELTRPVHAVCDRCHAPGAAPPGTPSMRECEGCHRPRTKKPSRLRRLITDDLHFRHTNHRRDRTGKPILCAECHSETKQAGKPGAHVPPATRTCVVCHDNVTRTPSGRRMRVCETCHAGVASGIGRLAPRSHLPAPDRPQDHTLAFRRDHSMEAELHGPRCARCHTFMSASTRDTCDECHQVMRPRDHVIMWREYEHGPAAATRADRCATCHAGDFCNACHSRPPRSHYPLFEFRNGGHGPLAMYELRACMTCHVAGRDRAERGCSGSGCHTVRMSR